MMRGNLVGAGLLGIVMGAFVGGVLAAWFGVLSDVQAGIPRLFVGASMGAGIGLVAGVVISGNHPLWSSVLNGFLVGAFFGIAPFGPFPSLEEWYYKVLVGGSTGFAITLAPAALLFGLYWASRTTVQAGSSAGRAGRSAMGRAISRIEELLERSDGWVKERLSRRGEP